MKKIRKLLSILTVFLLIAYVIYSLIVTIEVIQDRLQHNSKCLKNISYSNEFEGVKEMFSSKIMQMPERNEIACFVITTINNRYARSVIRRTWGKALKPIFIMNVTENYSREFLNNEVELFGDMIVVKDVEFADHESLIAMKYFKKYFANSEYFIYVHDDAFVNTKNLFNFLNDDDVPVDKIIGNIKNVPHSLKFVNWISNVMSFSINSYLFKLNHSAYAVPGGCGYFII